MDARTAALRDALDRALAGRPRAALATATEKLVDRYRRGGAADAAILADETYVAAYAAYRMPATYAACARAFDLTARCLSDGVGSVVDLGGGTGAAAWAADAVWGPGRIDLLEQVDAAASFAREVADFPLLTARWQVGEPVPTADLVSISYVLSELSEAQQARIVDDALAAASTAVVVIEPGTPDGHRRVLAARQRLVDAGWQVAAPCPQSGPCPVLTPDWCHFAARVERSAMHRQIKGGDLSYEDEKFSFVAAVPPGVEVMPAAGRVLRHPGKRKGFVELTRCDADGTTGRAVVTKKQKDVYRAARDARWGDAWPPGTTEGA